MATEGSIFNLLKPIKPPETVWDKIYEWLVGRAKVVILITQLIIALSFFGKIYVDTEAKSKDEEIEQVSNEISFFQAPGGIDSSARITFTKDSDYRRIWDESSYMHVVLEEIYSYLANPNSEISIQIDEEGVSASGRDTTENLRQFEAALDQSTSFTSKNFFLSEEQKDIAEGFARFTFSAELSEEIKRESLLRF